MKDIFSLGDALGSPAKVIHVFQPEIGLKGVLVVDNVATGPAIGGLRMAEDVSVEECARLARAMKTILPRQEAAIEMATKRVRKGMELKRWSIF